ncbi:porin [Roseateles asaccharophilus]|uniref:Porin n=1 Tax=Roseateles asaccharophilus TaxID=582607 RepID=A0ABU2A6P1_9BURK|nr:porin [Roseateles asaccharophilus]MDR7332157.1 putative porin [Roseateles asaccharophilus]
MMKKTLALTALALAAGATQAQTNVTIYGILDAAVEHLSGVGANSDSIKRMPGLTGGISPSRLGFRGTEDLGDGLKAVFTLEQGLGVDSGTLNQGGRAWGRQVFVGLQGAWGTVSFGRQYSMLFWSQLDADILGPAMFGSGSLDSYLPNSRVDNSIAYRGTFSGVTLGATYSFGRDAVNAGPSPSGTNCAGEAADSKACKQWSLLAKYDTPTWGVSAAVDEIRGNTGAFAGLTSSAMADRRSTVAGWVKLGTVKLGAGVIDRKNEASATTPKSQLWYLGASYPVTPAFTLDGQVFKLDFKGSANQATLVAVRGVYSLSKRTAVYATAGHVGNDGTLALGVSNAAAGNGPAAGGSQTGLGLGVRHSF